MPAATWACWTTCSDLHYTICGKAGHDSRTCPQRPEPVGEHQPPPQTCRICGEVGHNSRACPQRPEPVGEQQPLARTCGVCGEAGHNSRTCPAPGPGPDPRAITAANLPRMFEERAECVCDACQRTFFCSRSSGGRPLMVRRCPDLPCCALCLYVSAVHLVHGRPARKWVLAAHGALFCVCFCVREREGVVCMRSRVGVCMHAHVPFIVDTLHIIACWSWLFLKAVLPVGRLNRIGRHWLACSPNGSHPRLGFKLCRARTAGCWCLYSHTPSATAQPFPLSQRTKFLLTHGFHR